MRFETNEEIEHIAMGVKTRTLPKSAWTHAAHIAAAVWFLCDETCDAEAVMPDMIRTYNEATGVANTDTDGYHETITRASLRAARHYVRAAPRSAGAVDIVNEILAGPLGASDWLLAYWSETVLFSVAARRNWTAPDRAPFPF